MKKVYIKRLLSLMMVLLLVFPVLVSASSSSSIIKKVYFKDEAGDMVFVDYEAAINQSLEGDNSLYNGIKHYVGIAEAKGRPIYLETDTGKIIDFKLAMIDNLFRLEDIIENTEYEVDHEIEYSHELKIVGGEPVIDPIESHTNYTIDIYGPETLKVGEIGNFDVRAYGDGEGNVNYRARYEYRISGGPGILEYLDGNSWREIPLSGSFGPTDGFTLTPDWDVTTSLKFTPTAEGTYSVNLTLKDLDENKTLADADHILRVTKVVEIVELVSITPVSGIEVEAGTSEEIAIGLLPQTTTIIDSKDRVHTVDLSWTMETYDGNIAEDYTAIGRFDLPEGIQNSAGLELKVEAIVTVGQLPDLEWPIEVEDVTVGKSQITNRTYANIDIKNEYIPIVEKVYVDNTLANNIEDRPSQWRIEVEDGTIAEELKARVRVEAEEPENPVDPENPGATVAVEVLNASDFIPALLKLKVIVENIPNSAKYDVVYQLSGGAQSNTEMYDLGTWTTEAIFFNPRTITDKITVRIYDATGTNLLHTFTDVVIENPMLPI